MRKTTSAFARALTAVALAVTGLGATQAVAPATAGAACASPTGSLSGTVQGEDGRFVSAQVSLEFFNSAGTPIGMDGCAIGGGYSTTALVNNKPGATCCFILPAEGSATSPFNSGGTNYNLTKSWSVSGIPSNATEVWIETYTKRAGGQPNTATDRYGHSLRRNVPLTGAVTIHQPLRCGIGNGTTGSVAGRVFDNGNQVTASRVSAFSTSPDDGNGGSIIGFNVLTSHPSGSYRVDALPPGTYAIFVTANGVTKRVDGLQVSSCSETTSDVAVRGSVPRIVGKPVSGDWDGDGDDEPGVWVNGRWYLRTDAGPSGVLMPTFYYGAQSGDVPVAGDWDGDGDDEPGIFRRGVWHLRATSDAASVTSATIGYGAQPGDVPVPGDWDADGDDDLGIFRRGVWHLRSTSQPAGGTIANISYGAQPGDVPVAGDWDDDGGDDLSIYRRGTWHYRSNASPAGGTVGRVQYGVQGGDVPLAGQWDGDGEDEPAIYRAPEFHLRGSSMGNQSTILSYIFPT